MNRCVCVFLFMVGLKLKHLSETKERFSFVAFLTGWELGGSFLCTDMNIAVALSDLINPHIFFSFLFPVESLD